MWCRRNVDLATTEVITLSTHGAGRYLLFATLLV